MFSPTGNVSGAAVVSGNHLYIRFISPNGTFGTLSEAPIIAVSISVSPSATLGAQARLTLDPTQSWWLSPLGQAYPEDVKSGTFTVAGSVAISEVDPGTGVLPAGATIVIKGFGFQPKSQVEIDGITIAPTRFVSSSELDVALAQPTQMYARRVRVTNPDGSLATYYCYSRTLQQGQSARPLLSTTLPIFARQTFSNGYFLTPADSAVFLGLGFQNPNSPPANIILALYSRAGQLLGQTTLVLPADTWISRDVSEFLPGVTPPDGSYWYVTSSAPVQMIGLIGSDATGTVVPVNPSPLP